MLRCMQQQGSMDDVVKESGEKYNRTETKTLCLCLCVCVSHLEDERVVEKRTEMKELFFFVCVCVGL